MQKKLKRSHKALIITGCCLLAVAVALTIVLVIIFTVPNFNMDAKIKTAKELYIGKVTESDAVQEAKSLSVYPASSPVTALNETSQSVLDTAISYDGQKLLNEDGIAIDLYKNGQPIDATLVTGFKFGQYVFLKYVDFNEKSLYYKLDGETVIYDADRMHNVFVCHSSDFTSNPRIYKGNTRSFVVDTETGYILDLFKECDSETLQALSDFHGDHRMNGGFSRGDDLNDPEWCMLYRNADKSIIFTVETIEYKSTIGYYTISNGILKTNSKGEIEISVVPIIKDYNSVTQRYDIYAMGENGVAFFYCLMATQENKTYFFYSFSENKIINYGQTFIDRDITGTPLRSSPQGNVSIVIESWNYGIGQASVTFSVLKTKEGGLIENKQYTIIGHGDIVPAVTYVISENEFYFCGHQTLNKITVNENTNEASFDLIFAIGNLLDERDRFSNVQPRDNYIFWSTVDNITDNNRVIFCFVDLSEETPTLLTLNRTQIFTASELAALNGYPIYISAILSVNDNIYMKVFTSPIGPDEPFIPNFSILYAFYQLEIIDGEIVLTKLNSAESGLAISGVVEKIY